MDCSEADDQGLNLGHTGGHWECPRAIFGCPQNRCLNRSSCWKVAGKTGLDLLLKGWVEGEVGTVTLLSWNHNTLLVFSFLLK